MYKANDKRNGIVRALKRVKLLRNFTAFPCPALREIHFLAQLNHVNIVKMHGMAAGDNLQKVFCVLEYAEHDLGELIAVYPTAFTEPFVQVHKKMVQKEFTHRIFFFSSFFVSSCRSKCCKVFVTCMIKLE